MIAIRVALLTNVTLDTRLIFLCCPVLPIDVGILDLLTGNASFLLFLSSVALLLLLPLLASFLDEHFLVELLLLLKVLLLGAGDFRSELGESGRVRLNQLVQRLCGLLVARQVKQDFSFQPFELFQFLLDRALRQLSYVLGISESLPHLGQSF